MIVESEPNAMSLRAKLDVWQNDLIDMSHNNGLLYYKELGVSRVRVTGGRLPVTDVNTLFRDITQKDTLLSFKQIGVDLSREENLMLARMLERLRKQARLDLTERGLLTLYLVFGMLDWHESESSGEMIRSPLILAPVTLVRNGAHGELSLKRASEQEVEINPVLRERLDSSFDVRLPTYEEIVASLAPEALPRTAGTPRAQAQRGSTSGATPTLGVLFEAIAPVLNGLPTKLMPVVHSDEVHLGRFSFQKLVMRNDLLKHQQDALSHPLLLRLGGDITRVAEPDSPCADQLDERLPPMNTLEVLDADSSQQEAIEAAKAGSSFVLQGPPGTGKSQTITNIISEVMGMGKSVLFVSEKMAALEVVRRRLHDVNLDDFCLTLHDPNADKKIFIEELKRALGGATTVPTSADTSRWAQEANQLASERAQLNEYVRELHRERVAMAMSAFKPYGALAQLDDAPSSDYTLPNVRTITHTQRDAMRKALERLLDYTDVLDQYETHPWRETLVPSYSAALESEISTHFSAMHQALEDINAQMEQVRQGLSEDDRAITLPYTRSALERMAYALASPLPPRSWLRMERAQELHSQFTHNAARAANYLRRRISLDARYKPAVRSLDHAALLQEIREQAPRTLASLNAPAQTTRVPPPDVALAYRDTLLTHLAAASSVLVELRELGGSIAQLYEMPIPTSIAEIGAMLTLTRLVLDAPQPPSAWFEPRVYERARFLAQDADTRYNACAQRRAMLQAYYSPVYFSADLLTPMAHRFKTNYQSIIRWFNPNYWQDMGRLKTMLAPGIQRSFSQREADLYQGAQLLAEEEQLAGQRNEHSWALGRAFTATTTDWNCVRAMIQWMDSFNDAWRICLSYRAATTPTQTSLPTPALAALASGPAVMRDALRALYDQAITLWNKWQQEHITLSRLMRYDALLGNAPSMRSSQQVTLVEWLDPATLVDGFAHLQLALHAFYAAVDALLALRLTPETSQPVSWAELCDDLTSAQEVQAYEVWLAEHEQELRAELGAAYQGASTDWQAQLHTLEWVIGFLKQYPTTGRAPQPLTKLVSNEGDPSQRAALREAVSHAQRQLALYETEAHWAERILPPQALLPTGTTRENAPVAAIAQCVAEKLAQLPSFSRWLNCRQVMGECDMLGLGDLLNRARQQREFPRAIVAQFEKRLYTLLIDQCYADAPILRRFSREEHERVIASFRRLDRNHCYLARGQLRARLAAKRYQTYGKAQRSATPLANSLGAQTEIVTLRAAFAELQREAAKKRHRSIRAIVRKTAPALIAIKPCWMMSPLSVSQFIESGKQLFDLVIFDEASQISPEDAICAILRGKQVIVVGDDKQLPPTRFFSHTLADEETDEDDDDSDTANQNNDTVRSESILKEYVGAGLRSRSLRWHYRSRHESLIAFSNHEFYDDGLITFPTPNRSDGVQFVHVPKGVYDRSGSRRNKVEAERVVDLIIQTAQRTPDRSLGVVALSSAQENAIRDALETRMRSQPELAAYAEYLNEDNLASDGFFIKNLENVQGDEREVIILSVGYGRNKEGRVYTNFGPVNKPGGERRLNVAVTRAKDKMIVVSSIRAGDMKASSNPGVRTLRRYLDYAERGIAALGENALAVGAGANAQPIFESPFEQAVYTALSARGLQLDAQVGCSGYRIDLAVRDPQSPDRYLLGIECDGASYHSAKTARDRDRLRQQCLEGLGWHIHRIWSSDWFQNPSNEVTRVLTIVQQMIASRQTPPSVAS